MGEGGEKQLKAALKHAETVGPNTQKVRIKYAELLQFNFANRHFSYFFLHYSLGGFTRKLFFIHQICCIIRVLVKTFGE